MAPLFETVMVFGPLLFWKMPVSKEPSSAVRLWGTPSSRMATVTLAPCLTFNVSGLNLKFWMAMLSPPPVAAVLVGPPAVVPEAAVVVGLMVDDDLLPEEPQETAPRPRTTAAMTRAGRETVNTGTSEHPATWTVSNTSCCGDQRTAGG